MRDCYHRLKEILDLARDYELIEVSPLRPKLHKPTTWRRGPARTVQSPAVITHILQAIPALYRTMFLLLATTGIRIGECLSLRWINLDLQLETPTLSITHTLWRRKLETPKSKKSLRTIALPQQVANLLRAHRDGSLFTEPDDFIFCWPDGSPYSDDYLRRLVLYPALERAGIEIVPRHTAFHMFRHTLGTRVYEKTRDLKAVQELLGHATINITADTYVHPGAESMASAVLPSAEEVAAAVGWPEMESQAVN